MGIKYHSKGISKNKDIREQRKKPIVLMNKQNNLCIKCGKEVGNNVFTVCDDCWDKK